MNVRDMANTVRSTTVAARTQPYEHNQVYVLSYGRPDRYAIELGGVGHRRLDPVRPFPLEQGCDGYRWVKNQAEPTPYLWPLYYGPRGLRYMDTELEPRALFPLSVIESPSSIEFKQAAPGCDVFVAHRPVSDHVHRTLQRELHKRASRLQDFAVPMYENIVDPNMLLDENDRWVATDWLVSEAHSAEVIECLQDVSHRLCGAHLPFELVEHVLSFNSTTPDPTSSITRRVCGAELCGRIGELDPVEDAELHLGLEQVFNAALPALSNLRRPALVFPGKVQTVFKAQRIFLQPGEEYEGVWHRDGMEEHIVAVVLYYYRVSREIDGGQLEFFDRRPLEREFWRSGDCTPTMMSSENARELLTKHPHCKVDVTEGTMVVFSNFQMVHRVLRTLNRTGEAEATRDFVAFFVVDQREPLLSTDVYFGGQYQREHRARPLKARREKRNEMLARQLQPSGVFGFGDTVWSTGNGSVALLGFVQRSQGKIRDYLEPYAEERKGLYNIEALNLCPPTNRGSSWATEEERVEELLDLEEAATYW